MILGHDRPAIGQFPDVGFAGIDHGFDREDHAFLKLKPTTRFAIVQDLRIFMEVLSDAVATEFSNNRIPVFVGMSLYGMTDITQGGTGSDDVNAFPQAFERDFAEALGKGGDIADREHAAGVAVPPFLGDHRDVQIDDIAFLELFVTGDAMTDLVINRRADGLGVGGIARGLVVQWRGDCALHIDHVIVTEAVQFARGDPGFNKRRHIINDFGCETAGGSHFLNLFGSLEGDAHRNEVPRGCMARAEASRQDNRDRGIRPDKDSWQKHELLAALQLILL